MFNWKFVFDAEFLPNIVQFINNKIQKTSEQRYGRYPSECRITYNIDEIVLEGQSGEENHVTRFVLKRDTGEIQVFYESKYKTSALSHSIKTIAPKDSIWYCLAEHCMDVLPPSSQYNKSIAAFLKETVIKREDYGKSKSPVTNGKSAMRKRHRRSKNRTRKNRF